MTQVVEPTAPGTRSRITGPPPAGRLRWTPTTATFILLAAAVNTALYHWPLLSFAIRELDLSSVGGASTLATLPLVVFLETTLLLCLVALISHRLLKPLCIVLAVGNAVASYFIVTYHVILDVTMMGNVLGTNLGESSEFLNPTLLGYVVVLGILPAWLLTRVRIRPSRRWRLLAIAIGALLITVVWAYLAASAWLWIDKNSKRLGGMVLPWSYVINAARYQAPKLWTSDEQLALPPATFASEGKTVVILVIGEAARARNFSLYGYGRDTNPQLAAAGAIALRHSSACATYTSAAVRCMLSNAETEAAFAKRYEPLTSYLQRNGVEVTWRSHNFGEPPMQVRWYEKASQLATGCAGAACRYDDVLLTGLEERIRSSPSERVLIVIHQMGSHGPAYWTRYSPEFERFTPACQSVELAKCSPQELLNAYDNTILYEDHFLARTIALLKELEQTSAALIYMSDHGESLGEYGLYLHGVPLSIAPDVQTEVPFIVWMSDRFVRERGVQVRRLETQAAHSQRDVFHSVMGAFAMRSDAYVAEYDIFSDRFAAR